MELLEEISKKLQRGRAGEVSSLVAQSLDEGICAQDILNTGLIGGMNVVGEKFKNGELYVPEVLVAAKAMNAGLDILRPALAASGVKPVGRAVICTVRGDRHDIGKNLVRIMLEGAGIECVDLGTDVSADEVVRAVRETGAALVCLSALLTTTMGAQREVIQALCDAGLRDSVKVMVGGAPVTQQFADEIGADAYAPDAASASQKARAFFD